MTPTFRKVFDEKVRRVGMNIFLKCDLAVDAALQEIETQHSLSGRGTLADRVRQIGQLAILQKELLETK